MVWDWEWGRWGRDMLPIIHLQRQSQAPPSLTASTQGDLNIRLISWYDFYSLIIIAANTLRQVLLQALFIYYQISNL